MKTVVVISDTHNNLMNVPGLKSIMDECDMIISLGDTGYDYNALNALYGDKLVAVRGNCDPGYELPDERIIKVEGVILYITHGHIYRVKATNELLIKRAKEINADAVLYGHTHIAESIMSDKLKVINPGVLSGAGRLSYAYLVVNSGNIFARNVYLT